MPFCRRRLSVKRFSSQASAETSRGCRLQRQASEAAGGPAFLEFADNSLGDIAHCVNRTHHLLLADGNGTKPGMKVMPMAPMSSSVNQSALSARSRLLRRSLKKWSSKQKPRFAEQQKN